MSCCQLYARLAKASNLPGARGEGGALQGCAGNVGAAAVVAIAHIAEVIAVLHLIEAVVGGLPCGDMIHIGEVSILAVPRVLLRFRQLSWY